MSVVASVDRIGRRWVDAVCIQSLSLAEQEWTDCLDTGPNFL